MQGKDFKELMRDWRKSNDYSQQELADLLAKKAARDVSGHLVGKIETGERAAQEWLVIAFANLSKQDVNALLRSAGSQAIEKAALPS
jgi:transcriptional regulator with XRE-family HTH domain